MKKQHYLALGGLVALVASAAYALKKRPKSETEPESMVVADTIADLLNNATDHDTAVTLLVELKELTEELLNNLRR